MNTLFLASAPAGGNNMFMIVILIILGGFMYFGMIRPQKKQQQKRMQMMDQLKKGDKVILVDGLHGKIDSVDEKNNTVVIDADGIYLTFSRMAIRQVLPASGNEDQVEEKTDEKQTAEVEDKSEQAKKAEEEPAESESEEKEN